jgi:quercetin dioxygenase-like cupin family protein
MEGNDTVATSTEQWSTDLNARSAPRVTYAYIGPDDGTWEGIGAGLEARDLGAAEALDARVGARDVRATDGATLDWRAHTGDFLALYVRSGSASITTADGETHELGADDAVYLPPLHRFRAELTPGTVMIEITAPAAIEYLEGDAAPESSDKPAIVNRDAPDKYVSDGGPLSRTFFSYRDLGVTEATEGRIMLEVLRAVEPADRTGWHTHSMGQIALILSGKAMIQVEEHPPVALVANSTCYIGNRMRHDVYDVDDDYALLEVYMPADWDTIPCPAPKNAAPR